MASQPGGSSDRSAAYPSPPTGNPRSPLVAYEFLSRAAQESERHASSPDSNLNRVTPHRKVSASPIRKLKPEEKGGTATSSGHSSDAEANLVVVENPDGSLVEGMPSGFKHSTPVPSPPRSPRTFAFATTGLDLIELFQRHEKVFVGLFLLTFIIDSIIVAEEFTTVFAAVNAMSTNGNFMWSRHLGEALPYLVTGSSSRPSSVTDTHMRQTFSVFPPSWSFTSATVICSLDLFVCILFTLAGLLAYVSKKRKSYAWFATITCGALIWQVVLSCVDKLSLVLFLFRLACFTHTRFMGDLMDDIALLANLIGARVPSRGEQASVRAAADQTGGYSSLPQ